MFSVVTLFLECWLTRVSGVAVVTFVYTSRLILNFNYHIIYQYQYIYGKLPHFSIDPFEMSFLVITLTICRNSICRFCGGWSYFYYWTGPCTSNQTHKVFYRCLRFQSLSFWIMIEMNLLNNHLCTRWYIVRRVVLTQQYAHAHLAFALY